MHPFVLTGGWFFIRDACCLQCDVAWVLSICQRTVCTIFRAFGPFICAVKWTVARSALVHAFFRFLVDMFGNGSALYLRAKGLLLQNHSTTAMPSLRTKIPKIRLWSWSQLSNLKLRTTVCVYCQDLGISRTECFF